MTSRQAVVLAGGLGTRMLPRTETVPKVLLEVAGRPFSSWLLERIASCGYDDVVFCIGHLGSLVRDEVGDGARFGLRVRYVDEGQKLRGTGGAIVLALEQGVLEPEFLLTYGDSYLPFDYAEPLDKLRARKDLEAVMAVFHNEKQWDASNVVVSDDFDRVVRYEKGGQDPALQYIDYGATALRRSTFEGDSVPKDAPFGLDSVQHRLAREGRMGATIAQKRFFEIGSPQGLSDLEAHLKAGAR